MTGLVAGVLACSAASGARGASITVTDSCAYAGGQFAVVGTGFAPNEPVTLEIMPTADPSAGPPAQVVAVTASVFGSVLAILDVPAGLGSPPVVRSVRARTPSDPSGTPASMLPTAPLRIASRSVTASGGAGTADSVQRWRVTGLPQGTRLYAHYRHAGRAVAGRVLGIATDPCGRMSFDLRTLPRGFGRRGNWELWMTTQRTFRRPQEGIYVHRRLTASGPRPEARVSVGTTTSRLAPLDLRLTSPVTHVMAADASQIGLLTLGAIGMGPPVKLLERVDDRLALLGTGIAVPGEERLMQLRDATTWRCDRRDRRCARARPPRRRCGGARQARTGARTTACER